MSRKEVTRTTTEITVSGKIKIPFVGNNSAIRKINVVKIEELEIEEKKESKEAKIEREELAAEMISKIENGLKLSEKEDALLKSIIENKNSQERSLAFKKEALYFNPWVPNYYCSLKSIKQIQKFKKALWGEEIEKSSTEKKETANKFAKFWYD